MKIQKWDLNGSIEISAEGEGIHLSEWALKMNQVVRERERGSGRREKIACTVHKNPPPD